VTALLTTKEVFVDSNIVVVNWEKLSNFQKPEQRFLLYPVAINNGELVALKIIRFIRHAITAKALEGLEDVHLIGIGVGAGIATYVAKNIKGISKLTGKELHGKIGVSESYIVYSYQWSTYPVLFSKLKIIYSYICLVEVIRIGPCRCLLYANCPSGHDYEGHYEKYSQLYGCMLCRFIL